MQIFFYNKLIITFWKPILFSKINEWCFDLSSFLWLGEYYYLPEYSLVLQLVHFPNSNLQIRYEAEREQFKTKCSVTIIPRHLYKSFLSFYVYLCHCVNSFFSSNGCTQKTTDYSYRVSHRVPLVQLFHFIVKVTEAQKCEVIFSLKITQGVCHKYKIRIQISVLLKCSVL